MLMRARLGRGLRAGVFRCVELEDERACPRKAELVVGAADARATIVEWQSRGSRDALVGTSAPRGRRARAMTAVAGVVLRADRGPTARPCGAANAHSGRGVRGSIANS